MTDMAMTDMAMTEDRSLFENEEWVVGESGLEHKHTGYFIERDVLAQRRADGLWLWPLHVAEKNWCRMAPFMEAFSCAASVYGIRSDMASDLDLAHSFMAARRKVAARTRPFVRDMDVDPASNLAGRHDADPAAAGGLEQKVSGTKSEHIFVGDFLSWEKRQCSRISHAMPLPMGVSTALRQRLRTGSPKRWSLRSAAPARRLRWACAPASAA